ncbi:protein ELYS isoform X2 [Pseudoliparis swirei]|uniref:protein ELYS isoform X2 n=1 Tax=Pseudoliparis swirei TaxID=2059687 RepID=UPI0024BDE616|nr:protein ELYS isoform X2 [Pseudoliparis swirei]
MHDLTAQVTSSLLPFPDVIKDALGEDEITLDSVLHGKFTVGRSGLAWLACGPHLEVVHAVTGERLSAYCFSGGGEHPPCVHAARDFGWLKRSGLLVGLEEAEGSVLCLYDLGLSRVVKAVVIPGRITAIEPIVSYGGASTSTQHLHQSLRWFFGIAAVVTDLGHVLLVDLCLDDLSCSQSELESSDLQVVTKSPAEIPRLREVSTRQGRHLCLQLNGPSGVGATALQYIPRTNQLAVGFSDGHLHLWNMKTLKKEYHSQLEGGRVPVHTFTFQEPENDPRNCCYLWAVQSSQDLDGDMVSLRLLQMAFSERKCLPSGKILYEGLEYCEERYSQELSGSAFPLRHQSTNTRLLSCQTIEKFRPHPDRDDSMNEVASPDTSVSIFSWQVKAYGQGTPSTYIGVFDINRWYHAQMPDSLRTGETLQNCPYLAVWSLDPVVQMVSQHVLLDVVVHDRSLSRGLPFTCPPPEQYFNPTTYNFDVTCLFNSGIVHSTCSGYQKETLSFLKKAAPCSSDVISMSYARCLMSGLLSSRLADTQASSLSQEQQLDAIMSTAVETSSLGLITGCIKQWTAEEQPGSALNLRYILDWAWNKVVGTKQELDGICAPLFDSSSNFTDPQTLQLLQHSQRMLSNLSTIFHCLLSEAQELTQKGLLGLMNKNLVSSLISKYAQVVLWFCRTGLLPEGSEDNALQISRPIYTHSIISNYYTIRREELTGLAKGKWCADCLMIDGLVGQCGESLTDLWKRDEGGTGQYPPPTLHALLDIYLLDNIEEAVKNAIVIYLLLDVMYSFPNKEGASVESFPPAFAIPIGLVKLVQGLWLLDHHDHQSSFELLLHPAASQCQFEWQHERVLQALMCQGQHSVALRYFHVTKPPISSTSQAKLCLSVLLHNRCLVEAWSFLRQHSNRLNMGELLNFLYESCQELCLIKELLKLPLGLTEQESLEKFLQCTGGLQNRELLIVHYLQQSNFIPALQLNHSLKMNLVNERDPKLKERANTRNLIMDQYGKVLPRVQRKLAMERAKPYQHPCAVHREVSRPQPLSSITKRSSSEKVMSRAGFINNVLTKIEEVWLGKGATPTSSPAKSHGAAGFQSPRPSMAFSDPFLGTPITMTSKRKSRLMDLVVHPSYQTPRPLLSPPRPPSSWVSPKSISKAPELSLLQTPQVVKRARALAASGPVFSAFTPQSILRSSLRPTPVATPSASPGRSVTPPLRGKESRITFTEEAESPEPEKGIRWTNGMAAGSEISHLTRGPMLSKLPHKTWSSQPAEEDENRDGEGEQPCVKFLSPEGGIPSPQLRCFESESSFIREASAETRPSDATRAQLSLSFDTSQISVRSTDTTLEFYDAPLADISEDQEVKEGLTTTETEEEGVPVNIEGLTENQEVKEETSPTTGLTLLLASEDVERAEEEVEEDEESEDGMEVGLEEETKDKEKEQDEQDVESISEDKEAATLHEVDISIHNQVCNQVTESTDSGPEVKCPDVGVGQDVQTEATEPTEEYLKQSTDLTDFVKRHLFGSDLPLARSGIHNASQTQTSFNSESLGEVEEEAEASVEAPPVITSQISTASVTSSEHSSTDSHSVASVNDSGELSSSVSEEDEEDEEEEDESVEEEVEEEEEEDSGSEVEIIEEVQGNGRLPPLQPTSVIEQQGDAHFLPSLSEQDAAEFSLIPPGAEMKIVEEDMEGEVVILRLGEDEEGMEADEEEEQGSSYSTTLLVPLTLVEGQGGLGDGSQLGLPELQQTIVPDGPRSETHSGLSLILDMDDDRNEEADTLPMENDLQSSDPRPLSPAVEAIEEFVAKPEVILLSTDDQDSPLSGEVSEEEQRKEMDTVDGIELDGTTESELAKLADFQTENTETNHEAEDAEEQSDAKYVTLVEVHEPEGLSVSGSTPVGEVPAVMLAEDQEPEGLSVSGSTPVGEVPAVMLAKDQEPEGLSTSGESPVGEVPEEMLPEDQEPEGLSTFGPGSVEEVPAEMLADDQEPEGLSTSGASPVGEVPEEMLSEDQEPEGLSTSGPGSVEEVPAVMLADDQEPEGLSMSEPSPEGEVPAVMLADDQEPEGLSTSRSSPVGEIPAVMLADDEEPEGLSTSGSSPVGEVPAVMLADDQEPEGLSTSGSSPVGEIPAVMLADDEEPEGLSTSGSSPVGEIPAVMLADDEEPEGLSTSGSSPVGEVPAVMLADDQEPEGLSTSGSSPVGEVPAVMLADNQEPEGLSTSGSSPVGEVPAVMLADYQEPEGLSMSEPSPEGEVPAVMLADDEEPEGLTVSGPSPVGEVPTEMLADDQKPEGLSTSGPGSVEEVPAEMLADDQEPEGPSTSGESPVGEVVPEEMLSEDQGPEVGLSTSGPSSVEEVPAQMLADDQEPEGLSASGPSPVGELPAEMLADDEEPEGLSVSEPSPVEELPAEMLADDQEPEGLLTSGPGSVGELPAVVNDKEASPEKPTTAEEKMGKEDDPTPVDQEANGDVNMDTEATETATVVEEKQQVHKSLAEPGEDNGEEIKLENETTTRRRRITRGSRSKDNGEEELVKQISQTEEQPVLETPTSQRKMKAPSTSTRRTTRGRTVPFIPPLLEEAEALEEVDTSNVLLVSPRRTSRKRKQSKGTRFQASTPRRSPRNAQLEPPNYTVDEWDAVDIDATFASTSKASSPARRLASQRATPTRTGKRTQSEDDEEQEAVAKDTIVSRRASARTPTPAKRRTTLENTPRRSSRRTLSSIEAALTPFETLEEVNEEVEVFASPVKRNSRKGQTDSSETQPSLFDEGEGKTPSSPGRTTRQSNRITLNVFPQSARKMRGTDNIKEPELNSNSSRRPTRSKLWDPPEEDLPLLDSPLEVDSETPVADALIKRLKDEEERDEAGIVVTKTVRTSKRSTKLSGEEAHSPVPEKSSPDERAFIYSPSRRKTRATRAESPEPSGESDAPVTRSRRRGFKGAADAPHDEFAPEKDLVEVEKAASVPKTRKAGKRTAKSKAVFEAPPITEADLISPLASPADPLPMALKRILDGEAATSGFNLRRKRIMETVFTKPVTRRKKL